MSETLNEFVRWFNELSPHQKAEIAQYVCRRKTTDNINLDGYYGGPAPKQGSKRCPACGKPL
jgi:hypothetical protein